MTIKKYTIVLITQLLKVYHHQRQKCVFLIISKRNRMLMLVVPHALTSCQKKEKVDMHNLDVADFLIKYSIKSESALFVTEQEPRIVGETDLAIF